MVHDLGILVKDSIKNIDKGGRIKVSMIIE